MKRRLLMTPYITDQDILNLINQLDPTKQYTLVTTQQIIDLLKDRLPDNFKTQTAPPTYIEDYKIIIVPTVHNPIRIYYE
jgi:hypothetical protein